MRRSGLIASRPARPVVDRQNVSHTMARSSSPTAAARASSPSTNGPVHGEGAPGHGRHGPSEPPTAPRCSQPEWPSLAGLPLLP